MAAMTGHDGQVVGNIELKSKIEAVLGFGENELPSKMDGVMTH